MITEIMLIMLLSLCSAFEEINQLIQRGSWRKEDYYSFLIWGTEYNSIWKNFDSHHFAFGLFILILGFVLYFIRINELWQIPIFWVVFFYFRNLGLHIIFKKKPLWGYLWKI